MGLHFASGSDSATIARRDNCGVLKNEITTTHPARRSRTDDKFEQEHAESAET
jgi:hypothetical protein